MSQYSFRWSNMYQEYENKDNIQIKQNIVYSNNNDIHHNNNNIMQNNDIDNSSNSNVGNSCSSSKILANHVLQQLLNGQLEASNISKASSQQRLINKKQHFSHMSSIDNIYQNNIISHTSNNNYNSSNTKLGKLEDKIDLFTEQGNKVGESKFENSWKSEMKVCAQQTANEQYREQSLAKSQQIVQLQAKIQVLQKEKDHFIKKANSYLTENEELTIKISSLKQEYLSRLPEEKTMESLRNEMACLKLANSQQKHERMVLEEKLVSLQKTYNECNLRYNDAHSQNNNWQIKFCKLQQELDNTKLELHELQINNTNLRKVLEEERKLHSNQLQQWKARITKLEESSINDRIKTQTQYFEAIATFNQLGERCNKLEIQTVLEEKILQKDKQIILLKKKQKQNQMKYLELEKFLKEQNQKLLSKLLHTQQVENALRKQQELNRQNSCKISELKKENDNNTSKLKQAEEILSGKQNYLRVIQQKCKQMIQQNQRISRVTQSYRNNAQIQQENAKIKICELNSLIDSYHKNNENLFEQIKQKQQQIQKIKNYQQILKEQCLMQYKNLQVKCKELCIREQQYRSMAQKLRMALAQKQKQFSQLNKIIELKNTEFNKLNGKLQSKQKEINEFIIKMNSYEKEKQNNMEQLQQFKRKKAHLQMVIQQNTNSFKIMDQLKNKSQKQIFQNKQTNKQLGIQINQLHKICSQHLNKIIELTNINNILRSQIEKHKQQIYNINIKNQQKINETDIAVKQIANLKQTILSLEKQIKTLKQQKTSSETITKVKTEQLTNQNKQLNMKLSQTIKKLEQANAEVVRKQSLIVKQTQNFQKQIEKKVNIHKSEIKKCQLQLQNKLEKSEKKVLELQRSIQAIKISEQQLFAKYDQILKTNLEKDKVIHELQQSISKYEISEKDVQYLREQIKSQKQNNRRLKQFNGKLNEQFEDISEKYIKCYKELQQQVVCTAQLREYVSQLEQKITGEQNKIGKLVCKIGEVEEFTLRQKKQETVRSQQIHDEEKQQLEASIKFLSEELGIWSNKYQIVNKQNAQLRAELQKYRIVTQSSKASFQSLSASTILPKSNKNQQLLIKNLKDTERQLQTYKVEASILRQENMNLQKTMDIELQKRRQIIESLIKEKNILYSQITASSLSTSQNN